MKSFLTLTLALCLAFTARALDAPAGIRKAGEPITLTIRAPKAQEVKLRAQWSKDAVALTRGDDGTWSVTLDAVPAGVWEYSFDVDGVNVMDSKNTSFKPQREPSKNILHIASSPPAPWDWQDVPHGTVHQHGYASKALGRARELIVYTPPGYEISGAKKFPLLVLQHGSGDTQRAWVEHGKAHWILDNLIAAGKARPMVVVMLDGHPLGTTKFGEPAKRAEAMDAFRHDLLDDALPLVESLYRVEKDAAHRAIAGLSMGGWQSLSVGLGNMDRFAWVGSFSGVPPQEDVAEKFLSDPAAANSKLRLLWIAVGQDDFLRKRNEEFVAALKEKGITHTWKLTEGAHAWPVWRGYLAEFAPLIFADGKSGGR
ncbi:MAG: alpha/beta hydrolase-fold protein [Chthoniobacteraceae bacterium]